MAKGLDYDRRFIAERIAEEVVRQEGILTGVVIEAHAPDWQLGGSMVIAPRPDQRGYKSNFSKNDIRDAAKTIVCAIVARAFEEIDRQGVPHAR